MTVLSKTNRIKELVTALWAEVLHLLHVFAIQQDLGEQSSL